MNFDQSQLFSFIWKINVLQDYYKVCPFIIYSVAKNFKYLNILNIWSFYFYNLAFFKNCSEYLLLSSFFWRNIAIFALNDMWMLTNIDCDNIVRSNSIITEMKSFTTILCVTKDRFSVKQIRSKLSSELNLHGQKQ